MRCRVTLVTDPPRASMHFKVLETRWLYYQVEWNSRNQKGPVPTCTVQIKPADAREKKKMNRNDVFTQITTL